MIALLGRLFSRGEPALSDAGPNDAAAIAALHAASFQRGWSDGEVERLLLEPNVIADRVLLGHHLAGFVLARIAADEAEILSIAVDRSARGRGLGRRLLQRALQQLAARGVRSVFLEVDAANEAALALYRRMDFAEVGQRQRYYRGADDAASTALVLRRDLD
jgi:ribosomal-protein-alanine N-acetyltransferase